MSQKIKVEVNQDEILEGEQMILCLADQQILDGDLINDAEDILQNEDIKEKDKLRLKEKQKEQIKKAHYSQKYDEDKQGLLEKYDEIQIKKDGFYIQDNQIESNELKMSDLSAIRNKLNINFNLQDQIANDYTKPSIPTTFIKKKIQKQQPVSFLEERISKIDKTILEEDDYELLQRSILNQQKQKMKETNKSDFIQVLEINKQIEESNLIKPSEDVIPQQIKNVEKQELKIIASSTDFLSNVKTDKEMEEINLRGNNGYTLKDTRNGTTSVVNIRLPSERINYKVRQVIEQEDDEQQIQQENQQEMQQQQDDQQEQQPLEFLEEEHHNKGLSATLEWLRKRGDLSGSRYDYIGRNKDQKPISDQDHKDGEINLVYRDHTGKLMTPKEAYRYQCHIFHGEGPSKNKIEKKKRKELVRMKQKMKSQTDAPLMQALKQQQNKNGVAHMVIGKKKL